MRDPDLRSLLDSWDVELQAQRKTAGTRGVYLLGVRQYLDWCEETGRPLVIDRRQVKSWIADLLADEVDDDGRVVRRGVEANTAIARQLALRRFSAWLAEEGELPEDPLLGLRPPKVDKKMVAPLTEDQLAALIKACEGREFRDRRDEAIVRFIAATGARAGEVIAMEMGDVSLKEGKALIRRGKGGKARTVPFGPNTARAIDRYLRKRRAHRLADSPKLWLGDRGKGFGYDGMLVALQRRAEAAGIEGFHPHRLRHTFASRWLRRKGSESGLMSVAGWADRRMLDRYTEYERSERAAEEARSLGLDDL